MIDEAGSFDNLSSILDKTGDAASAETYLQNLRTVKDRLAAAGLNAVDEGGGNIRYFDSAGREVAVLENGTMRYTYGGYGGDIIIADPSDTVTVIGKYEDLMHPDWGTRYIVSLDGSIVQPMSSHPGGINALDVPPNQWQDLITQHGEELGAELFWQNHNEPFLRRAMENGDTIRVISDPTSDITRNNTFARELDFMEDVAASYGYVYDAASSSWVPSFKAGTP